MLGIENAATRRIYPAKFITGPYRFSGIYDAKIYMASPVVMAIPPKLIRYVFDLKKILADLGSEKFAKIIHEIVAV